ncbi:MAG: DinB family protein, partial [Sphingobacteriales bacterium]
VYFWYMKSYFINLFNYDKYVNEVIINAINEAGKPEKPVQLMAHTLAAQQVWLNRCLGFAPAKIELWPALGTAPGDLLGLVNNNHLAWTNFLFDMNEIEFNNKIAYKNTQGDSFENRLADIVTHVINHGTHHRAQIGQLLKLAGVENLPATDYIFYIRQLKN